MPKSIFLFSALFLKSFKKNREPRWSYLSKINQLSEIFAVWHESDVPSKREITMLSDWFYSISLTENDGCQRYTMDA
uniref:AlNc14C228G9242 protein n=1 Tax=Albugo laibachii Nc14 TaxID=890382 RepID=F0WSA3_9STRA|nr:AlNc14C228G9242 [Albugo laibachii Nc14]|eukprot:CCA24222.1 AlNc14C228G9242 [Albugo laibachii Nc14]